MRKKTASTLKWVGGVDGHVAMIDQTLLPGKLKILRVRDVEGMRDAIRRLAVRGAPAIGVAAAYGVVLGARRSRARSADELRRDISKAARRLGSSRPTAVNLFWALSRMEEKLERLLGARRPLIGGAGRRRLLSELLREARSIHREDQELCRAIGRHGAKLLESGWNVLTHCNAGALATGGSGTALAVIYEAERNGKKIGVFADETRPLLQGARLTSWELERAGIGVTLLCDNAAASLLGTGKVQCVIVGADRIAANGDVANKIGTYGVALLAREHRVPFYVAAPSTTFDLTLSSGQEIPIEERAPGEVVNGFGRRTAPRGVAVYNPAFDVTPARLIDGIITELGVIRPPFRSNLARRLGKRGRRAVKGRIVKP
jgi:methylthioribose-1-phosphate isomerase